MLNSDGKQQRGTSLHHRHLYDKKHVSLEAKPNLPLYNNIET
jgi:hypothetical protein